MIAKPRKSMLYDTTNRLLLLVLLLVSVALLVPKAASFSTTASFIRTAPSSTASYSRRSLPTTLSSTLTTNQATTSAGAASAALGGTLVNVTLVRHRPLGCVVEESLATNTIDNRPCGLVFVASVNEAGFAALAGLQVGDVIVAVTGLFGGDDLQDVTGQGMDIVKSLVSSCPDGEPLSLQVRRGTTVVADHEAALTELCANPDTSDAETDQCVLEYLQGGYSDNDYLLDDTSNDMVECDNEQECLLDNMQSMWAKDDSDGIDAVANANGANGAKTNGSGTPSNATVTTPKPWSSRTSPSGTFVRDPATRQMRNIG